MVKHIVLFKFDDEAKCQKAKELFLSMKGNVPSALNIEVGIDFLHTARSYDVVLMVDLIDKNALSKYQNDPYHCSVVKTYMHQNALSSVSIDYEF